MGIGTNGYLLHLLETIHLYNRYGGIIVRSAVAARVGCIDILAYDLKFIRLISYRYLACDLECSRVYLEDSTELCIRINAHRTYIGSDIGFAVFEADIAAVRYIYLTNSTACT